MIKYAMASFALCMISVVHSQTITLHGKVTDGSSKAVANATVQLLHAKQTTTTGADGSYAFGGTIGLLRQSPLSSGEMRMDRGVLALSVSQAAPIKIEIFDAKGNLLDRKAVDKASAGSYRFDLSGVRSENLLIVKASIGNETKSFPYFAMASGAAKASLDFSAPAAAMLAKVSATVDTLQVTASGFATKKVEVTAYDAALDVTLGTADRWGGLKNAPIKSAGCGKELGTISKSGTYTISSVGGRGSYIISLPTSYNKDTPYQLVFGNHCLGANAQRVAAADNGDDLSGYYSIKTLADKDNIPGIYVALQGNSDGTWNPPNDSKFWNDVLTLVETNLCVDTTRVFVTGFSFGAMFSYVLSLEYPEKIRAVATYAPANYNMTQPTNRHIPIAYYQTTGINDGTCPWIHSDAQKQGGKYCLRQHAEDNGCSNPDVDVKLATKGSAHVTTEFTGCNPGYPVKFGSFDGAHQAVASDPGSRTNWIENEAWEFFKQF